jgi:acyl transferase domain-containing protein/NADPH:quinone reductase-like Zn-dependent oxidoreductase
MSAALARKESQISRIGFDRWNHDLVYHPDRARRGKTYADHAGLLTGDPQGFDPKIFGINKREADQMDPQQKLLLELTREAVDQTLYSKKDLIGRDIGVFMGVSSVDAGFFYGQDNLAGDSYFMTGTTQSLVSNRISHIFGWNGPNTPLDTACSSSLVAIDAGLKSLQSGETEMVLIGGVSILLNPMSFVGFAAASMLSATGECHVFDQAADGYVRGEGGGVALLKPLDAALRDGDPIQAIIRSAGISHNGENNLVSFPKREAQSALILKQMEAAGVGPEDFAYYEAHGTGTPVGDPVESWAIGMSAAAGRSEALPVGSVKGNVGHLEPASGMAGLGKVLAGFRSQKLLPQANFNTPSENIDFDELNIRVVAQVEEQDFTKRPMVGLNSFGFGGVNGSMVLEAPGDKRRPALHSVKTPSSEARRIITEAYSEDSLDIRTEELDAAIAAAPAAALDAFASTSAARMENAPFRAVRQVNASTWTRQDTVHADKGPVFVFSGNGSQKPGMGRVALQNDYAFRAIFQKVSDILEPELGFDPLAALMDPASEVDLEDTSISQPLLFALQAAYVERMAQEGLTPAAVIGHSVGEVGAAFGAGALDLEAACQVVLARSAAQHVTKGDGKMFAIVAGADTLDQDELASKFDAHIAGFNSQKVTAVTVLGDAEAFADHMEAKAIRCIDIGIDYPFHSPGMEPVQEPLDVLLEGLNANAPAVNMYSTMAGKLWEQGVLGPDYWWDNVREPVHFAEAVRAALEAGHRHFIEIGPFPILVRHIRDIASGEGVEVAVTQIDNMADARKGKPVAEMAERTLGQRIERFWAMGAELDMERFLGVAAKIHPAIELPAYPYEREHHGMAFSDDGPLWRVRQRPHPLLGDLRPPELAFRNDIDHLRYPFLADHQVQNRVLYPGAGTLELMVSAARIGQDLAEDAPVRVTDFQLHRPMELSSEEWTSVRTSIDEQSGHIEVGIRPGVQMGAYRTHASGTVLPGISAAASAFSLPADEGKLALDHDALYQLTEKLDLQYGPHFRCVQSVRKISEDSVLAELALPETDPFAEDRETVHKIAFHPGMLDGAFQAALALLAEREGELGTFVPQGAETVHFLGREDQATKALITLRLASSESVVADLVMFDGDGAPVLAMERLRLMPMPSIGRPAITDETVLTASWVPAPARSDMPALVLAEPAPAGEDILVDLAKNIALRGMADLGLKVGGEEAFLSIEAAMEAGHIGEEHLAYVLALLSDLSDSDMAVTEDGDLWEFPSVPAKDELSQQWISASKSQSGRVGELALLAHRLDHFAELVSADNSFASGEAPVLASLARGVGSADYAGHLSKSLLSWFAELKPSQRIAIRFVGAGMSYTIGAVMGAVRRGHADWPIDYQIVSSSGDDTMRAEVDLAGFASVSVLSEDDLPSAAAPDCTILMPDFVSEIDADDVQERLVTVLRGAEKGSELLASMHCDGFLRTMLFGAKSDFFTEDGDGLPIAKDRQVGSLSDAIEGIADLVSEQASVHGFDLVQGKLRASLAAPLPDTVQIMPSALPRVLDGVMVLDMRNADLPAAPVDELHRITSGLANANADALERFVLVSRLGNASQEGLAAALGVVANENSWNGFLHLAVDEDVSVEGGIAECIRRHTGETLVRIDQSGETVLRHLPLISATDRVAEVPGFTRRLRGVLEPVTRKPAAIPSPKAGEIVLQAEASGLNFRDVMYAMRLLPSEALEDGFTGATIGMEAAGTVIAVGEGVTRFSKGDRAVAFASDAFASHVVAKEAASVPLPENMTSEEAATILTSYVTAWYGLVYCARVKKGDRVLVQAGAGALGLAAIQVAKHLGCTVAATAGSSLKQSVVRAMGADFVSYSRDGSFAAALEAEYGRESFACVLNSVSGAAVEDGIRLLKPFGQFVEFGKRDFYENRPMFMKQLRRNITFHGVDTDQLLRYEPELATVILNDLMEHLQAGDLAPVLHETADVSVLGSVMSDMQSSRHVGKLVLTHPQLERAQQVANSLHHNSSVPSSGAIAVIGGAAGFGFAAVERLARLGAKNVYVITRTGKLDEEHAARADALKQSTGCKVQALAADASDKAALGKAFDVIRKKAGALTGVVQAAMVLRDGIAADSTSEDWQDVFRAKTAIDDAVSELTKNDELSLNLVFSSATTMIGNPGQANYVAANRMLEQRMASRAFSGQAGLAIGWGAIGDAGYLSRNEGVKSVLEKVIGQPSLHTAQAMDLMEKVLTDTSAPPVVYAMPANWSRVSSRLTLANSRAFGQLIRYTAQSGTEEDDFLERLKQMPAEETLPALEIWLREKLADALRVDAESLAMNRPLADMGLDSLLAVEFAATLEAGLDLSMDASSVNADMTIGSMAQEMHGRIFGAEIERAGGAEPGAPTGEEQEVIDKMSREHLGAGETAPDARV